jgi:cellulose synthase operon protein B
MLRMCCVFVVCCALAAIGVQAPANAEPRPKARPQTEVAPLPTLPTKTATTAPQPDAAPAVTAPRFGNLTTSVALADIGFANGFRFANLGGRREVFVPVPQGPDIAASELVLALDDVSPHDAKRSLEILINDRVVAAIPLDGRQMGRTMRVPLAYAKPREGFIKLSFLYSGAATQDRCIDVRYVGDSLTIRPESSLEIDVDFPRVPDVGTTAALMPRDVMVVLPRRPLVPQDIATALTLARSLTASGRRVTFHHGFDTLRDLVKQDDARRWVRGVVLVGSLDEASGLLDAPLVTVAGAVPAFGTIAAARIGGFPTLLVSDVGSGRAGRLFASPSLSATRGIATASVGETALPVVPTDRISFDRLGLAPAQVDVFGRADLSVTLLTRALPAGTQAARLVLDVMVAPDGAGEKAVVSAYVNERLLGSTVAATGEPTRLDLTLPDGLVGTTANVRAVVQRRSAQGDCRFEPQGYPAQILASSAVVLASATGPAHDFSDLAARWANGIEVLLSRAALDRPAVTVSLVAQVLSVLSPETAPITVKFVSSGTAPAPDAPFLAVSDVPPSGITQRVRFDQGRVAVADRGGRTLLDLGGFVAGAVAQTVASGAHSGLWIKPLARDGSLPAAAELRMDRGDVAFIDKAGVALAMSTERDTLVQITYPEQISWLSIAERFRAWIIGGLWLLATVVFLLVLQRLFRRRAAAASE